MSADPLIMVDGIKWQISQTDSGRVPIPLCPKHSLRLKSVFYGAVQLKLMDTNELKCEECPEIHNIPRSLLREQRYVLDKMDARDFRQMKTINLDDQAIPIAVERGEPKDSPYWAEVRLVESKTGPKLVIYAGERGRLDKAQVFVDPQARRMGFDQNDAHPTDVFVTIEATFKDGTKSKISSE